MTEKDEDFPMYRCAACGLWFYKKEDWDNCYRQHIKDYNTSHPDSPLDDLSKTI